MYTGQIDFISNRADWTGPFCQIIDNNDGSIINILNTDVAFDCSVYIENECGWRMITGSIENGRVIASDGDDGPGFQWSFVAADLQCLQHGSYRFIVQTTTNGEVNDLIVGTLGIVRGN